MEGTTVTAGDGSEVGQQELGGTEVGEKGLQGGAIGFLSNVVIGVASVAPGYSIATTLGFIVAIVGLQSPAITWVAFVPMLLIADRKAHV